LSLAKEAELEEKEREELLNLFGKLDTSLLKSTAEALSMFARAFEGQPIEPENVIKTLIDHNELMERSRFPTYPLLSKQVYLRLIAIIHPEAVVCESWADLEAKALIEYKGLGRDEYVDIHKAAQPQGTEQLLYFGSQRQQQQQQPKKSRWQFLRGKQHRESEFSSE